MKTIIAGGRDFNNHELMTKVLYHLQITEVVCGMANGADELGRLWAIEHGIPIKEFLANWERYGKAAGHKRNAQMAEYGQCLVAFWDQKSKGTANMIKEAKKRQLEVIVIPYNVSEDLW